MSREIGIDKKNRSEKKNPEKLGINTEQKLFSVQMFL